MSYKYFLTIFLCGYCIFNTSVLMSGEQVNDVQVEEPQAAQTEDLWSDEQIGTEQQDQFQMKSEVQEIAQPNDVSQEVLAENVPTDIVVADFEKPEALEEEVQDIEGIHTVGVNDPEGNWLFKRIWWEKSKNIYGKMRDRVDKITESRIHFFSERVKLDRQYTDPFYINIGFDRGALTEMINHLLELLNLDRAQVGALGAKELEQYNILMEEKNKLLSLQAAAGDVRQLDNALDDALQNLMQQVNLARSYERQAWQLLEAIAEELSDKKAREHYYVVATLWRNVKDIGNYIVGPFSQHFFEVGTKVVQQIKMVEEIIAELKTKGVELSRQVEDEHEKCPTQEEQELQDEPEEPAQKDGWFSFFTWKMVSLLLLMLLGVVLIVYRRIKK